jgi:hypothetical protein
MDPYDCSKVFSPMSALVGALCTILTGLVIYPIYDYLGIDLDKSIYSQIYGDGESDDTPVPFIRHVHTFQNPT